MVSVRKSGMAAVAVQVATAPVVLEPVVGAAALRTEFGACAALSWRLAVAGGGNGGPWASDGPWSQMVRDWRVGDYDARGGDMAEAPSPREGGLTVEDIARIDRAVGWLVMLGQRPRWTKGLTATVSDGQIVAAVARADAIGGDAFQARCDWVRMARGFGLGKGCAARLRMRHARALDWLAAQL